MTVMIDETSQAMNDPRPGDHFTEMYSFHVVVVDVDGEHIITAEGNGKFPQNAKFHRQTLDEFRRYFGYSEIPGYWIRLYRRNVNVDGWLNNARLSPRKTSTTTLVNDYIDRLTECETKIEAIRQIANRWLISDELNNGGAMTEIIKILFPKREEERNEGDT